MDSAAIFGFVGVLVGASSTYIIQRGAEGREDKANTRVGVRLSHLDLMEIKSILSRSLEKGVGWTDDNSATALSAPVWREHDAALAKTLPLEDWMTVEYAVHLARVLDTRARNAATSGGSGKLTDLQREAIQSVLDSIEEADEVLTRWLYKTQPIWVRAHASVKEKRRKAK